MNRKLIESFLGTAFLFVGLPLMCYEGKQENDLIHARNDALDKIETAATQSARTKTLHIGKVFQSCNALVCENGLVIQLPIRNQNIAMIATETNMAPTPADFSLGSTVSFSL